MTRPVDGGGFGELSNQSSKSSIHPPLGGRGKGRFKVSPEEEAANPEAFWASTDPEAVADTTKTMAINAASVCLTMFRPNPGIGAYCLDMVSRGHDGTTPRRSAQGDRCHVTKRRRLAVCTRWRCAAARWPKIPPPDQTHVWPNAGSAPVPAPGRCQANHIRLTSGSHDRLELRRAGWPAVADISLLFWDWTCAPVAPALRYASFPRARVGQTATTRSSRTAWSCSWRCTAPSL